MRWVVGVKGSAMEAPVESDSAARSVAPSKANNNGSGGGGEESRVARVRTVGRSPGNAARRVMAVAVERGRGGMEGIIGGRS